MRRCWKPGGIANGFNYLVIVLSKRNIIGVDATSEFIKNHQSVGLIFHSEAYIYGRNHPK